MSPPDRIASASARLHCRNRPRDRCVLTTQHPMGPALSSPEILLDWAAPGCNDPLSTYRRAMPSPAFRCGSAIGTGVVFSYTGCFLAASTSCNDGKHHS